MTSFLSLLSSSSIIGGVLMRISFLLRGLLCREKREREEGALFFNFFLLVNTFDGRLKSSRGGRSFFILLTHTKTYTHKHKHGTHLHHD